MKIIPTRSFRANYYFNLGSIGSLSNEDEVRLGSLKDKQSAISGQRFAVKSYVKKFFRNYRCRIT